MTRKSRMVEGEEEEQDFFPLPLPLLRESLLTGYFRPVFLSFTFIHCLMWGKRWWWWFPKRYRNDVSCRRPRPISLGWCFLHYFWLQAGLWFKTAHRHNKSLTICIDYFCPCQKKEKENHVNNRLKIGRVAPSLCFKTRLSAKPLVWKWIFYYYLNKTHIQNNGFAVTLVFKVRDFWTWKWPFGLSLPSFNLVRAFYA